jgi:hypothetical protein
MATTQRKDFTQTALAVVRQATGEATVPAPTTKKNKVVRKTAVKQTAVKRRQAQE